MLGGSTDMSPAARQGLLAAGLGMLANNQGGASLGQVVGRGGLLGVNAYAGAQEEQMRQQQAQQQMALQDAETKMKQQQLAIAVRDYNTKQGILGQLGFGGGQPMATDGSASPPSVTAAIGATPAAPAGGGVGGAPDGSGAAGGVPPPAVPNPFGAAPGSATAGALGPPQGMPAPAAAPAQPGAVPGGFGSVIASLTPEQRVQAGLAAVGMKDVGAAIAPDFETLPSGIQINKKTGQPTGQTFPITDNQGHSIRMVPDGQGGYGVAIPKGSLQAFTQFSNAAEAAKAGFAIRTQTDQNGNEFYTTDANIIRNLPGGMPGQGGAQGGPGGGQGAPGGGMGGQGGQGGAQGQGAPTMAKLSPARTSYLTKTAEQDATDMHALDTGADAAPNQIAKYQQLGSAVKAFNESGSTEAQQALQEKLKSIIPGYKGGTSLNYGQIIDNLGSQMTADMRGNLGMQRMTDSDLKYLNQLVWAKAPAPRPPKRLSTRGWRCCSGNRRCAPWRVNGKRNTGNSRLAIRKGSGFKTSSNSGATPTRCLIQKRGNDGYFGPRKRLCEPIRAARARCRAKIPA